MIDSWLFESKILNCDDMSVYVFKSGDRDPYADLVDPYADYTVVDIHTIHDEVFKMFYNYIWCANRFEIWINVDV